MYDVTTRMSSLPEVEEPIIVPPVASTVTLITTPLNQVRKEPVNGLHLIPTPPSCPKETTLSKDKQKDGSAKGKREAPGPIVTTSDEDEPPTPPDSPRESRGVALSPTFHDHDYENVSSPGGSSTTSETPYVRQPGFVHHAHTFTISKPKSKKKKTHTAFISYNEGLTKKTETTLPVRTKPKRDPIPMKMRAFPQSFWQQPNVAHNVSPAQNYPLLPPLVTKDGEEAHDVRPVSPTGDEKDRLHKFGKVSERKVTAANTELLFKLFEGVEKESIKPTKTLNNNNTSVGNIVHTHIQPSIRRGRPRKVVPVSSKTIVSGEDPYLVDCVTDNLFPQLTLEHSKALLNGTSTLQVITLREGDKSVTLPSLSVDQNYSQMLSELVMHI